MTTRKPPTIKPLDKPTSDALDLLVDLFDRYVIFPSDEHRDTVALWVAHTYVFAAFDYTPRLSLRSTEPGSGKTLVLDMISEVAAHGETVLCITPAVMWRLFETEHPTLLIDEADTLFGKGGSSSRHADLRSIINAGHKRGAIVKRAVGRASDASVKSYNVNGPVAMAGLGVLPDTIESRSIPIPMRKPKAGQHAKKFRYRYAVDRMRQAKDALEKWSVLAITDLARAIPEMPAQLTDGRKEDVWEPLVAIADMAGDAWATRARKACVKLTTEQKSKPTSLGVQLLSDLRLVMAERDNMFTSEIMHGLLTMPDTVWTEDNLDARKLGLILAEYDVKSTTLRRGDKTFKGYRASQLVPAWRAFLSPAVRVEDLVSTEPVSAPR